MTIKIANLTAQAMANAITARVDAGSGAGKLRIYSGTPPADADAALAGNTLLAELTLSDPSFGSAADAAPGAIITANAITGDTSADATGTATFFRMLDSDNNVVYQGTCSASGGGGDMILNSTALQSGAAVDVTSLTLTVPEQ